MRKKDFEDIIFGEQIEFRKKEKEFESDSEQNEVLIEFINTPYNILVEKLKAKISSEQTGDFPDVLYVRYKDSGDSWEIGYVNLDLKFWKYVEDIFYNYKPEFYYIAGDNLVPIEKGDLLRGEKFFGGELDGYIE